MSHIQNIAVCSLWVPLQCPKMIHLCYLKFQLLNLGNLEASIFDLFKGGPSWIICQNTKPSERLYKLGLQGESQVLTPWALPAIGYIKTKYSWNLFSARTVSSIPKLRTIVDMSNLQVWQGCRYRSYIRLGKVKLHFFQPLVWHHTLFFMKCGHTTLHLYQSSLCYKRLWKNHISKIFKNKFNSLSLSKPKLNFSLFQQ